MVHTVSETTCGMLVIRVLGFENICLVRAGGVPGIGNCYFQVCNRFVPFGFIVGSHPVLATFFFSRLYKGEE